MNNMLVEDGDDPNVNTNDVEFTEVPTSCAGAIPEPVTM